MLESRFEILSNIIYDHKRNNTKISNIKIFGSVLIPSKQFLARFKYRPWKGVYCSSEFLESVDLANNVVLKLLEIYKQYNICPIVETSISTDEHLKKLKNLLQL